MKTALKKIKGLGTAGNGVHHWWMQRITAIALIPLVIFFALTLKCAVYHEKEYIQVFDSPLRAAIILIMLLVMLYHATLGIKVIVEDYVHCKCAKLAIVVITNLLGWLTGAMLIVTIISEYI